MVNDACKDSFKRFIDEPTQVCPPPSEDVNNEKEKQEVKNLADSTVKHQTRITPCLKNFRFIFARRAGYYDSEGDVLYLESLLSEDTTHNLSSKVFFDHEPQQLRNEPENEPLITFSPKSDPLHHEFTSELITIPLGIVREHESGSVHSRFKTYSRKDGGRKSCLVLVYEKSCHLPIELEHKAYWALKHANFDIKTAGDHRKLLLNELNELCDQAYENSLIYKERTKKLHDSKIKNRIFNVGDRVLLFNSRLKIFSGKLKTRWSGPFTITKVFPYGTIELSQPDSPNFKVNGHRVKHYFGGDLPPKVVQDLHTLSKDE
ncbi:hypothetical protein Tco_0089562 [Tanacetum coccineum]